MGIGANLAALRGRVAAAARRGGRDPDRITIVGVTKYSDVPAVNEAVAAGLRDIGENRVQDAARKFPLIVGDGVVRHMIGHLQSNKAREAVRLFDLIHSVDSVRLAEEIARRAGAEGKRQDILLQVNIAREAQKSGLFEEELEEAAGRVARLPSLRLLGLMTMAPLTEDRALIRGVFVRARDWRDRMLAWPGCAEARELSMGMSHDVDIAAEEGATLVRVGSAIFKND